MAPASKWPLAALALLPLPTSVQAAAKPAVPRTPASKVKPLRIITTRVTMFYAFKDKKTNKIHPMAAVSKTLNIKVVRRPTKGHPTTPRRKKRK